MKVQQAAMGIVVAEGEPVQAMAGLTVRLEQILMGQLFATMAGVIPLFFIVPFAVNKIQIIQRP